MEPEGVLVTMRAYLNHILRTHCSSGLRDPRFETGWLAEQVAKWSIDAYYSGGLQ